MTIVLMSEAETYTNYNRYEKTIKIICMSYGVSEKRKNVLLQTNH